MGRGARGGRGRPRGDARGVARPLRPSAEVATGTRPRRGGRTRPRRPSGRAPSTSPGAFARRRGGGVSGIVYLVGAGPGDPKLITVRGVEVLGLADVVVYDRLASPALLELAPSAERIYAGKEPGRAAMRQEQIDSLLVERALAGEV